MEMDERNETTTSWLDRSLWADTARVLDTDLFLIVGLLHLESDFENEVCDDLSLLAYGHRIRRPLQRLLWLHCQWANRVDRSAPVDEVNEALEAAEVAYKAVDELAWSHDGHDTVWMMLADGLHHGVAVLVGSYGRILRAAAEVGRRDHRDLGRRDGGA
jgi:hypothetical protein